MRRKVVCSEGTFPALKPMNQITGHFKGEFLFHFPIRKGVEELEEDHFEPENQIQRITPPNLHKNLGKQAGRN